MKKFLLPALLAISHFAAAQRNEPGNLNCFQPPLPSTGKPAVPATAHRTAVDDVPEHGTINAICPGVLNVNIHYILRLNGTGNFNETDDGTPYKRYNATGANDPEIPADTANSGYVRAQQLVTEMNVQAATNPLNGYPAGSSNPAKGFSYALNGVYFHRVSPSEFNIVKSRSQGIYTDSLFNNYGVNKASEINIFITGDYQDPNASAFDVGGLACTIGYNPATPSSYWLKVFNSHRMYEWRQINKGDTPPFMGGAAVTQDSYRPIANTLGHEIGHLIGLSHTFEGANGCADAQVNNPGNG